MFVPPSVSRITAYTFLLSPISGIVGHRARDIESLWAAGSFLLPITIETERK